MFTSIFLRNKQFATLPKPSAISPCPKRKTNIKHSLNQIPIKKYSKSNTTNSLKYASISRNHHNLRRENEHSFDDCKSQKTKSINIGPSDYSETGLPLQYVSTRFDWISRKIELSGFMSRSEAKTAIRSGAVLLDGHVFDLDVKVPDTVSIYVNGIDRYVPEDYADVKVFVIAKPANTTITRENVIYGDSSEKKKEYHAKLKKLNAKFKQINEVVGSKRHTVSKNRCISELFEEWYRRDLLEYGEHRQNNNYLLYRNLIPIAPLRAANSRGIQLFTNDREFAKNCYKPSSKILSIFNVRVSLDPSSQYKLSKISTHQGGIPDDYFLSWRNGIIGPVSRVDYGPVFVFIGKRSNRNINLQIRMVESPERKIDVMLAECTDFTLIPNRVYRFAYGTYTMGTVSKNYILPKPLHDTFSHLHPDRQFQKMIVPAYGTIHLYRGENIYKYYHNILKKNGLDVDGINHDRDDEKQNELHKHSEKNTQDEKSEHDVQYQNANDMHDEGHASDYRSESTRNERPALQIVNMMDML